MKKRYVHEEVVAAIFLIAIGIFFLVGSFKYKAAKYFPLIISILVLILSTFCLIEGLKKTKELNVRIAAGGPDVIPQISWYMLKAPFFGYLMMLLYVIGIKYIGFFVSTTIFMPAMMYFMHYRNWKVMIITTIGLEVFIYFFFVRFVGIYMPKAWLI